MIVTSDEFVICKTESTTMPLDVRGKDIWITKESSVEEACEKLKKNEAQLQNGSLRSNPGSVIGEMLAVNTTLSLLSLNCKQRRSNVRG